MEPATGLASLFDLHRPELLRFLRARCGQDQEAEDCLQELWIKASQDRSGPIASGRAYLFRMANNLVSDLRRGQLRAMRRDRHWIEAEGDVDAPELRPDPNPMADEALIERQEAQVLAQAIEALPPGARRALQLHRIEGHSQAEVAEIMGISRSGVEKHMAVAMKNLRSALLDWGFFGAAGSQQQGWSEAAALRPDDMT